MGWSKAKKLDLRESVPIVISGPDNRRDKVKHYNEISSSETGKLKTTE